MRQFPNNVAWRIQLARIYRQQGAFDAAEEAIHTATTLVPRYYSAYIAWGEVLESQGLHEDASAKFRQAVEIAPWSGESHLAWARALQRAGDLADALAAAQQAYTLLPQDRRHQAEALMDELGGNVGH